LRGGLKRIEASLGIPRRLRGIGGYDAMVLWQRWEEGDEGALATLLDYNRDDVVNLATLERRLRGDLELPGPLEVRVIGAASRRSPDATGTSEEASPARAPGTS
jgi:hypothetical protein